MLIFVVGWRCGCGCEGLHRMYVGTYQEALDLVDNLSRESTAAEIWIWRYRMPRNKEATLVALNEAAGLDVELVGDLEQLAKFVREDTPEAKADGAANDTMH